MSVSIDLPPVSPPIDVLLIDGRRVEADGATVTVTNPADGQVVGSIPAADGAAIDAAVQAAHRAFGSWSQLTAGVRAEYLLRLAAWVEEHKDALARLTTLEQGKPLSESRSEAAQVAKSLRYYAAEATRLFGETIPTESGTLRSTVIRQPIGVAVCIVGWNYPLGLMAWKIAPALAAGCTVVAKPSSQTPFGTLALAAAAAEECGFPPGVLNVITGAGGTVGEALVTHPLVRKVSFTGGNEAGLQILQWAAQGVKRVTLELGGHSPMLVAPDAPLELAVRDGVKRAFRNAGQLCNSVNRIYVHRSVADRFTEEFVEAAAKLRVGSGLAEPEPDMGPLTTQDGLDTVARHVEDARRHGGEVVLGGARPADADLAAGFFFEPTVIAGATEEMAVLNEETFGPVAPIAVVDDMDEAVARANRLDYGLVAYVYTKDLRLATLASERLEFGTVNVNNVGGGDVPYPYAGWKHSGLGVELSRHGMLEYLNHKHVRTEIGY
jgi:succinate-semialdehyde dehydrogenase / glutarate-semialdehyde dehydrogenase